MANLTESQKAAYDRRLTTSAVSAVEEGAANGIVDNSVSRESSRYRALAAERLLPRTLMGGTEAMRLAGETFLPKHDAESEASYKMRLNGCTLYNGFERTVVQQASKMFGKSVNLTETVPALLQELSQNVDGQGRAITAFSFDGMKEGFVDGIWFILVDFPKVAAVNDGGPVTLKDQQQIGARPLWSVVTADKVIGWRSESINGQMQLTQVRIRECSNEPVGPYGEEEVHRVRVLEPGRFEVWRRYFDDHGKEEWRLEDEGNTSLSYIPLVPVYINRAGFCEGKPPLATLAELNKEHWVSSSEQRYALTFSRFAMLFVAGAETEGGFTPVIGPNKSICLPQGGTAGFIEPGGTGIAAGQADLEAIEKRMGKAGMEVRVEDAGQVTATAAAIDSHETNAALRAVAQGLEDALETALQISADYLNLGSAGDVEVYKDFAAPAPEGGALELTSLRNSGVLSLPTLWHELKRRRVLSDEFDLDTELQLLEIEQGMGIGANGVADPAAGGMDDKTAEGPGTEE